MIKLGGNINLKGFDSLDTEQLVVLKKIVGNKIRDISKKSKFYESVILTLDDKQISALLQVNKKDLTATAKRKNLFFALNDLFDTLEKEI